MSRNFTDKELAEQQRFLEKSGTPLTERAVNIADNDEFIDRFDPSKLPLRPTKFVVVKQEPEPGSDVPAGTPVKLFMAFKEDFPVESFNNIEVVVKNKYPNVKALLDDLEKKGDPMSERTMKLLTDSSKLSYDELREKDVPIIDAFVQNRFNIDPATQKEQVKKIYDSLRFLSNF